MVQGDGLQDASNESAGLQRFVSRYRNVMFTIDVSGQANVGSLSAHPFISEYTQSSGQIVAFDIARDSHTASSSSLTKWSRIRPGISPASPSPK